MSSSRRLSVLTAFAIGLAPVILPVSAEARKIPTSYASGLTVDVSRLRAQGVGIYADLIQAAVLEEAQRVGIDRSGALAIRITGLSLSASVGGGDHGGGGDGGGSSDNDYLEGEILTLGPRGEILNRHPLLTVLPSNASGAWYNPQFEQRRILSLAKQFVDWARRGA